MPPKPKPKLKPKRKRKDDRDYGYFADYYQAEKTEQYVAATEYNTEMVNYYSTITTNFYDTFIRVNEMVDKADERILKIIEQYTNIINQLVLIISLIVAITASFLTLDLESMDLTYRVILSVSCTAGAVGLTDGIFLSIKMTDVTTDFIGGQACDYIETDITDTKGKRLFFRHFASDTMDDLSNRITWMIFSYIILLSGTVTCGAVLLESNPMDNLFFVIGLGGLFIYICFQFLTKYSYVINWKIINSIQNKLGYASNQESLTAQLEAAIKQFHQHQSDLYCIIHSHGIEMRNTVKMLNKIKNEYEETTREREDGEQSFYFFEDIRQYNLDEQLPGAGNNWNKFNEQIKRMHNNTFQFDEYTTEEMKDYAVALRLTQLLSTINSQRTHMAYLFMRHARWNSKCDSDDVYDWSKQQVSCTSISISILQWLIILPLQVAVIFALLPVIVVMNIIAIFVPSVTFDKISYYVLFWDRVSEWKRSLIATNQNLERRKYKVRKDIDTCRFENEGEWKIKLNKALLDF